MDTDSTKLLTIVCPGKKVPIRKEPRVQSDILEYACSGDVIEVNSRTVSGFFLLAHNKGYINKSTKGVDFIDVNTNTSQAHDNSQINDNSTIIQHAQPDKSMIGLEPTREGDDDMETITPQKQDDHYRSAAAVAEISPVKWHTVYDDSSNFHCNNIKDNDYISSNSSNSNNTSSLNQNYGINIDDDKEFQQKEEQQRLLHMLAPSPVPDDKLFIDNLVSIDIHNSSTSPSSLSIIQSFQQALQSPRSTLQYYQQEFSDVKTHVAYYYQQVGTLQPWNEFMIFVKHPQCNALNIDRRLSSNFLHYRSNYLIIFIAITTIYTMYTFLFFPIVLLLVIPFLILTFYCLVVNKASITLGEITITTKGKRYLVIMLLTVLLGITGGLTKLIWILLFSSILCFVHMFITPTDSILLKSQSV